MIVYRGRKINSLKLFAAAVFLGSALLVFMPPVFLSFLPVYSSYGKYIKLFFALILFGLEAREAFKTGRADCCLVSFLLFGGCVMVSSIYGNGSLSEAVWTCTVVPAAVILLMKLNERVLLRSSFNILYLTCLGVLMLMLVLNLAGIKIGIDSSEYWQDYYYWQTERLSFGQYTLLSVFLAYRSMERNNQRWSISNLLLLGICIAGYFYLGKSKNVLIFTVLWGVFLLLDGLRIIRNRWKPTVFILVLVLGFLITQLGAVENSVVSEFLSVIKESNTFSGRTPIWTDTCEWILQEPALGYGVQDFEAFIWYWHPHCHYLQILFQRGLFGFAFFLLFMTVVLLPVRKNSNLRLHNASLFYLFCVALLAMFDNYNIVPLTAACAAVYYANSGDVGFFNISR